MGWYVTQLWMQLLLAMLVGLFAGWLLWRWGWKKHVLTQQHEVTRLRQAAAERDTQATAHRAQLVDLRADQDRVQAELAGATTRAESAEAELATVRARVAELEAEHATCAPRFAELETEHAACAPRVAELDAALLSAQARVDEAQAARARAESLVIDLRDEDPDDLKVVEGIGPKFEQALNAAGIRTWRRLARTDEATLRTAIEQAGMSFAPSLVTWAEQADLLARGEMEAFKALTDRLIAGRAPGQG